MSLENMKDGQSSSLVHCSRFGICFEKTEMLLVKEFPGHASLENSLLCIRVERAIFGLSNDDEYDVTATNDVEYIKKSVSIRFEYV